MRQVDVSENPKSELQRIARRRKQKSRSPLTLEEAQKGPRKVFNGLHRRRNKRYSR